MNEERTLAGLVAHSDRTKNAHSDIKVCEAAAASDFTAGLYYRVELKFSDLKKVHLFIKIRN